MSTQRIDNFMWWLNTSLSWNIKDNQFTIAKNVYYNTDKQIETRRWYRKFGNKIGNAPITSQFFFQKDDGTGSLQLCVSGTQMYKYDSGTWTSIKTGLTEFETNPLYTSNRTRRDFAVYKNVVYMCNGVNTYASYDGATYTEHAGQPPIRYVSQLTDRLFGAWDDANPNTLYYSAAAPANWNAINTNLVVVWWDENGIINGIGELWQVILALKSNKIYAINVSVPSALPIDSQSGGYCDRSISNVGNSIVFFNERGIDTLQQRTWATGSQALESKPLSDDLRSLIDKIQEKQYNSCASWYAKKYNNYYFSFDTDNNNIPDTTLVYNSLVWSWTQYTLPLLYDYGFNINNDQERQYLFSSGAEWQMYEFEYGYDDDGETISYEVQSKDFDFDSKGTIKTFEYVDIIGQKSEGTEIDVKILVEWEIAWWWEITDNNIQLWNSTNVLSIRPISTEPLWASSNDEWIQMYPFSIRVPLYQSWMDVAFNLSSEWWQRILEKARIWVNWEPIDVYYTNQII